MIFNGRRGLKNYWFVSIAFIMLTIKEIINPAQEIIRFAKSNEFDLIKIIEKYTKIAKFII
jgi:hypothetical protein